MAHNRSCEAAKHPGCACGGCGGALHGWPGFSRLAKESPEVRREHRETVDDAWYRTLRGRDEPAVRPRTPTLEMKRAAAKRTTADMVDLLAGNEALLAQVEKLGGRLSGDVRSKANGLANEQTPSKKDGSEPRKRTLGHFWCSLLAELSGAANRVDEVADAPSMVAAALPEGSHPFIDHLQERLAVLTVRFVVLGGLQDPVLIMRIMAVFMCPDPAKHPQIANKCLFPLVGEAIGESGAGSLGHAFGAPDSE